MQMDIASKIIEYECGDLDDGAVIDLFQELLDSGLCWRLQGHYGRMAQALLDNGFIFKKGEEQ